MANCRQCGTKLPSITFGDADELCKSCRAQQLPPAPAPTADLRLPTAAVPQTKPTLASYALIAINVLIFIVMVASGVSWMSPQTDQVLHWGADYGPDSLNGQYWRLLTSMFLHFGIIHLFGNMWCLWSLGQLAERFLGALSLVAIYLLTGLGAALLSLSWDPIRVSAGASGAIFGIAGALIAVLYFGKLNLPKDAVRKLLGYVVRFSLLNLLFGLQGHIDNMAHLGGLISGLLLGFFLAQTFKSPEEERPPQLRIILAVSAVVLLVLFVPVARANQYAVELTKGEAAYDQRDYAASVEHFKKFVAARPQDAPGHALLGLALRATDREDEAAREFERALELNPNYPFVQVNLAKTYTHQKQTKKAIALFRKGMPGIKADASDHYWYAVALKESGNLAEAESQARNAISLDPKDADAHTLLADILAMEGKKGEAATKKTTSNDLGQSTSPAHSSK